MNLYARRMKERADFLRQLANAGLTEKHDERMALALLLESQARIEARLDDFLNRASVLLSQSSSR